MENSGYQAFKRIGAVIVGILLIIVSAQFSVQGFAFQVEGMEWVGWVLAIAIIVIELVWNSERQTANLTLKAAGIAAYSYGMWTNIAGIRSTQGAAGGAETWIFPAVLGIILEVVPEPLIIWGLLSEVSDREGDFLGTIMKMFGRAKTPGRRPFMREEVQKPTYRVRRPPISKPITPEQRATLYTARDTKESQDKEKNEALLKRFEEIRKLREQESKK